MVDAHDEGGHHIVLGGGGDNDLLRTVLQMGAGLFHGVERAGGLNDVFCAAVIPGDLRNVAFAVDPDLLAVDDEVAVVMLHSVTERAEHGVVLHLIYHIIQIRIPQVDAADLITAAAPLYHDPQSHAADAAEAVDTNFNCHIEISSCQIVSADLFGFIINLFSETK